MKIEKMAMELLGLPATQRALLAKQLIASLDETEKEEIEALWVREAAARYAEIEAGKVECRPVDKLYATRGSIFGGSQVTGNSAVKLKLASWRLRPARLIRHLARFEA